LGDLFCHKSRKRHGRWQAPLKCNYSAARNDAARLLDRLRRLADQIDQPVHRGILGPFLQPRQASPYGAFIVGVEENLFPSPLSLNSRADLEEERRLFYVALTRAEQRATVTYASTRYRWGTLTSCEVSRFVEEIDPKYVDYANSAARGEFDVFNEPTFGIKKPAFQPKTAPQQKTEAVVPPRKNLVKASTANSAAAPIDNSHLKKLEVGMTVKHDRFGIGKVAQLEGPFPNTKATVVFEGTGQKQLLLKFAKLEIVG